MEFGPRPRDRPGIGKVPGFGPGFANTISARDHRRINRSSAWSSDFGSLTLAELEDRYPSGKVTLPLHMYPRSTRFLLLRSNVL
jgi:hypothetical protein